MRYVFLLIPYLWPTLSSRIAWASALNLYASDIRCSSRFHSDNLPILRNPKHPPWPHVSWDSRLWTPMPGADCTSTDARLVWDKLCTLNCTRRDWCSFTMYTKAECTLGVLVHLHHFWDDANISDTSKGTWCSWLSRSLSMREVLGSIPNVSISFLPFNFLVGA
jgi:hypothetical protein